ncbi:MAG: hypothetical protein WAO35_09000 [Terriglobia bacterium]
MKFPALVCSFFLAAVSTGAGSAILQQSAAPPQVARLPAQLSPAEIELYKGAQTLIAWTPRQIHDSPFLHKLRPPGSQDELPMVLDRAGQTVARFYRDFPKVACVEQVLSEAMREGTRSRHGMPLYPPKPQKFLYIVIPRPLGDLQGFEEYRTDLKGNPVDASSLDPRFTITADFVSTGLYLSAADQPDSTFRYFGIQAIRNRECHVVGFAQNPERVHSVGVFIYSGKPVVLLVQGLAWIDLQTFQIVRVVTWLLAPRTDISLKSETSTVDFFPVQPSESEKVLWLPRDVTVEIVYRSMVFRNTHHYSNFKLFRAETTIKPGP